jgi:hypothetical protein
LLKKECFEREEEGEGEGERDVETNLVSGVGINEERETEGGGESV